MCVCERESLFRFQSSKVKKDSQPEPESESEQTESTSKTLVVVVAIVRCICKYVPTTEAIQSEYVTNQCPNERPRRVRNAAANSGTNLKPVYMHSTARHGKGIGICIGGCSRS